LYVNNFEAFFSYTWVTVTSFHIRRHVGGTQLLHQCYVINAHMLENFHGNYTLHEMHVLRITLAQEMSDFRNFTKFLFA